MSAAVATMHALLVAKKLVRHLLGDDYVHGRLGLEAYGSLRRGTWAKCGCVWDHVGGLALPKRITRE